MSKKDLSTRVCVREREVEGEREGGREGERERERERGREREREEVFMTLFGGLASTTTPLQGGRILFMPFWKVGMYILRRQAAWFAKCK